MSPPAFRAKGYEKARILEMASLLAPRHIILARRGTPSLPTFKVRGYVEARILEMASLLAPQHVVYARRETSSPQPLRGGDA